jgi:hypothetical protein
MVRGNRPIGSTVERLILMTGEHGDARSLIIVYNKT